MDVRATTDAPPATGADTIVVGIFEGKGVPHDVENVALGRARELGARELCWELPHKVPDAVAGALVEGTLLAAYRYTAFKSQPGEGRGPEALVVSAHHDVAAAVDAGRAGAEAANRARDLGNAPANVLTPEALAERARALAGVQVDVMGPAEIEAAGMGAFSAVAQGAGHEPRLITVRYEPAGASGPLLGLVGKGVT